MADGDGEWHKLLSDHGAVRIETLLSQASPHLGATRLRITPDYDGVVQLSFAFTLWSQHAPRFPIAQMSGLEMEQAVTASGQSFEARPPAAADREAVWYPGYVQIRGADGDCNTRSLPGYSDHIFWDSDTWVFPALLLLYPERAKSLVAFRERTLDVAQQRARRHGFAGAMYPWEADPDNGSEQTPHSAFVLSESEIHVTAEIAIAQWQYYLATQDRDWLRQHGWPVIRAVTRFWASRATYDAAGHRYQLEHVNSVAESQSEVRNDTFTNLSARKALQIATAAARVSGDKADPLWERIARELYIPIDEQAHHHLPFDPSIETQSKDFGGGPLPLLFLPSLDLQMDPQLREGNYDFAVRPASLARVGSFSMGLAPHVIAAAVIGNEAEATRWLDANYSGGTLKPPFHVRTETAGNNTGYFITGSAGYLQSLLYGFSGLRAARTRPRRSLSARAALELARAHAAQRAVSRETSRHSHRTRCERKGVSDTYASLRLQRKASVRMTT